MNNKNHSKIEICIDFDIFTDHSFSHSNPLPPFKDEYLEKGNEFIRKMKTVGIDIPEDVKLKYDEVIHYSSFQTTLGRISFSKPIILDSSVTEADNVKLFLENLFKCQIKNITDLTFTFSRDFLRLLGDFEIELSLCKWEIKSIRVGKVNISDCYVHVKDREAYLVGAEIQPLISGRLKGLGLSQ